MKKLMSFCLIIAHIMVICGTSLASDDKAVMKVVKVIDNIFSSNLGQTEGISKGDRFYIIRHIDDETMVIGKSKVVYIEDHQCALRIEEQNDYPIEAGDLLVKDLNFDDSDRVIEQAQSSIQENDPFDETNYYSEGQDYAATDYNSTGAFIGGLLSGFGLGIIGWTLGYIYVAYKGVDVPEAYTRDLGEDETNDFSIGYEKKIKSKRKTFFNGGALIGVIGAVVVIVNSNLD